MAEQKDWTDWFVNITGAVNAYLNQAVDNIFKTYQLAGDILDTFRPRVKSGASSEDGAIIELECDTDMDDPEDKHELFKVHTATGEESWKENVVTEARLKKGDLLVIQLILTDLVYSGQEIQVNYSKGDAIEAVKGDNKRDLIEFNEPLVIVNNSKAPNVFVSAETNKKGDKVIVNFNKDIKANASNKYSKFTLNDDTDKEVVSEILDPDGNGDINILELTVDPPILLGKTVTINYVKDSSPDNTVKIDEGADGIEIDDFEVAMPVTNDVVPPGGLESAEIEPDGKKIILTFNKDMKDPDSATNKAKFTVDMEGTPNTVGDLEWADTEKKIIKLKLDTTMTGIQTADVSYDETGTVADSEEKELVKIDKIPVTNPKYLSAETTRDGKTIKLKFDKDMEIADPSVDKDKFIVTKDSTDALNKENAGLNSDDNTIIELIMEESIGNGYTIDVKYEGDEGINAKDGGKLVKFDDQRVENKSVAPDIFDSAEVSVEGDKVLANFKKDIAENPSGNYDTFKINDGADNNVSPTSLDGGKKIIELTVEREITHEKGVKIWYEKSATPEDRVKKDPAGELDNFDPIPALNPIFQSAETSADGKKILLTFSKGIADPIGKHGEFKWDAGEGDKNFSKAESNGEDNKIIVLTVEDGDLIPSDKPVKVSYLNSGTVTSVDGGTLIQITEQEVTVKVVKPPTIKPKPVTDTEGKKISVKFDKEMADPSTKHGQFNWDAGGGDENFLEAALNAKDKTTIDLTVDGIIPHDADKIELKYTAGDVTSMDGGLLVSTDANPVLVEKKVLESPTCQSAKTSPKGDIIILTFGGVMANPSGKETQFKSSDGADNRVTAVALGTDKKTIELTLVRAITHDKDEANLNVEYTAGDVMDKNGGKLLTFDAPQSVTKEVKEPPTYVSSVTTKDGKKVIITFSKAMGDPSPDKNKFGVTMDGAGINVTTATNSGDKIELTLKKALEYDTEVKVQYTGENVLAGDEGILAPFENPETVDNQTAELTEYVSSETSTNGQKITLNFNNNIKDPSSEKNKFIVKMEGNKINVTAAAIGDKKIDLTLETKIVKDKPVTVQLTSKNILDEFDRKVPTFSAEPVENKVTA